MELSIAELAIILRPFYTETARRLCIVLLENDAIRPELIDASGEKNLEEPRGKTMERSLDAVIQVKDWAGMVPNYQAIEDKAFNEARPRSLALDLKRLEEAVLKQRKGR